MVNLIFFNFSRKYCQYGREPLVFINTETGNSRIMTTIFSPSNRERFAIQLIKLVL